MVLDQVDYTYDYAGNRLTRDLDATNVSGAPTDQDQAYSYDGLHRLTNAEQGTWNGSAITSTNLTQDWALDQLGNWSNITETDGTSTTLDQDRTHNAVNEIDGNGGDSITGTPNWADPAHDAAGNMTTMPQPASPTSTFSLTYDAWNRLVSVSQEPYFEYDGLGRRIVNEDQGTSRHYYYNEQWQMLEERVTGYDDRVCQYVWHTYYIDALAVRWYDEETDGNPVAHYYLQDANFNVTAVTDDTGVVVERYHYTPYGQVTFLDDGFGEISASAIDNQHLYTGRERDPETGLQLNRNRYYAAHLGRWLTRDPREYNGSRWNLHEYVGNRPVVRTDPMGLFWWGVDPHACVASSTNRRDCLQCCKFFDFTGDSRGGPGCERACDEQWPSPPPGGGGIVDLGCEIVCGALAALPCCAVSAACAAGEPITVGTITVPCSVAIPAACVAAPAGIAPVCTRWCKGQL